MTASNTGYCETVTGEQLIGPLYFQDNNFQDNTPRFTGNGCDIVKVHIVTMGAGLRKVCVNHDMF